jgi:hypothetical protein
MALVVLSFPALAALGAARMTSSSSLLVPSPRVGRGRERYDEQGRLPARGKNTGDAS